MRRVLRQNLRGRCQPRGHRLELHLQRWQRPEDHPASYHYYMRNNFFNHIDIPPKNINILDGVNIKSPDVQRFLSNLVAAIHDDAVEALLGEVDQ